MAIARGTVQRGHAVSVYRLASVALLRVWDGLLVISQHTCCQNPNCFLLSSCRKDGKESRRSTDLRAGGRKPERPEELIKKEARRIRERMNSFRGITLLRHPLSSGSC